MWIERLMAGISHQHVLSYNPTFLRYAYNDDEDCESAKHVAIWYQRDRK